MENTWPILAVLASVAVALATGVVSNLIFSRQKELAARLEKMAGILKIQSTEGKQPLASLAQVLKENEPQKNLRILAISGASIFKRERTFRSLLSRGIDVEIMLLDPDSDNWLFKQYPWLKNETRESLNLINLITTSLKEHSGRLSIRLYPQPLLELLMFIDNKQLFLSSYFPIASSSRLIYQIGRGEQSLYKLYDEAFSFLWESSQINQAIDSE